MLEHEVVFRCIVSSLPASLQLHFLVINNHNGGRKHLPPSRSKHTWISEDLKHSVGETIYMNVHIHKIYQCEKVGTSVCSYL